MRSFAGSYPRRKSDASCYCRIGWDVGAGSYLYIGKRRHSCCKRLGIPTATDIAFAMGIMSVMGNKVPVSLKVFLTALAIADDLGAILVVAFFYGGSINFTLLTIAAVVLLEFGLSIAPVKNEWRFILSRLLWYGSFSTMPVFTQRWQAW